MQLACRGRLLEAPDYDQYVQAALRFVVFPEDRTVAEVVIRVLAERVLQHPGYIHVDIVNGNSIVAKMHGEPCQFSMTVVQCMTDADGNLVELPVTEAPCVINAASPMAIKTPANSVDLTIL
jgi:hypothetical protein